MSRGARVAAGLMVALVIALLTLEGALQGVAAVVWFTHRPRAAAATGQSTVLCVGDSYTYGVGASNTRSAYPAQLEQLLRRRGEPGWRVFNGGWPGNSSRDVLLALTRQLAETRPKLLYVLVGANDGWTRPQRVTGAELSGSDPHAFAWRWRTGRLLALVRQGLAAAPRRMETTVEAAGRPARLLGTWSSGRLFLRFAANGTLYVNGQPFGWSVEDSDIVATDSNGTVNRVHYRLAQDRLRLSGSILGGSLTFERQSASDTAPTPQTLEGEAWAALNAGNVAAAERDFRDAIAAASEPRPMAHAGLVAIGAHQGRRDLVQQELAWLRRNYTTARDRTSAEALLAGLEKSGDDGEVLRFAEQVVAAIPEASGAWTALAWQRFQRADTAAAVAAIARAVALSRTRPREQGAAFQRQAWIVQARDPKLALASLVRAYTLSGYANGFTAGVGRDPRVFPRPLLTAVLDSLALPPAQRADVEGLYTRVVEDRDTGPVLNVLEAHLRAIAGLARAAGAQSVIVSYPFLNPGVEQAQQRAAAAARAGFLAIRPTFDSLLRNHPRADYVVPDGHLNDAGYAIVARLAADDAARRLARQHD